MPETNMMKGSNDAGFIQDLMREFRGARVCVQGLCTTVSREEFPQSINSFPLKSQQSPCGVATIELITSRKPDIKFLGNLALGSSSCLKYFMICVSCFQ